MFGLCYGFCVFIRATVMSTGKIRYGVLQFATNLTATGTHTPYRITWCYLPPGRGDIPPLVIINNNNDNNNNNKTTTYIAP